MQFKSYLVENNINILDKNLNLFYGENLGLINEFKDKIKKISAKNKVLIFDQDEILKNQNLLMTEITNFSLFEENKIFFINQVNDKFMALVEEIIPLMTKQKIYLFSDLLDKKSKLRSYFEKSNKCSIVACYEDNEITLKNIINNKLTGFDGLTAQNINLIIENIQMNRLKLNNELEKIKIFFKDRKIKTDRLEILLNVSTNDNFNLLKDVALIGNKIKTNKLLSDTVIETEKIIFYINIITQRLTKIREIINIDENGIEKKIDKIKPPIFWKDKSNYIIQSKIWTAEKIKRILSKTYELELSIKSNSLIDKRVLMRKLMIDICELANS